MPATVLDTLSPRRSGPVAMAAHLRAALATTSYAGDAVVGAALVAAGDWLAGEPVEPPTPDELMLTHGDGNLANLVWDGSTCRVVDHEDGGVGDLPYEVADLVEHVTVVLPGLLAEKDLRPHLDRIALLGDLLAGDAAAGQPGPPPQTRRAATASRPYASSRGSPRWGEVSGTVISRRRERHLGCPRASSRPGTAEGPGR